MAARSMRCSLILLLGLLTASVASTPFAPGFAQACTPSVDDSGFGGVDASTPYDAQWIARALPGCRVEPASSTTEGEVTEALVIRDGAVALALIYPDWAGRIYSVMVENPAVKNRIGPAIGTPYSQIYPEGATPICTPGVEEAAGRVLCAAQPGSRLIYLFEGLWQGPDDTVPPPSVLNSWRIAAFLWRPAPFEDPRWVDVAGFDPGEGPAFVQRVRAAVDDPVALSGLVLYPIDLLVDTGGRQETLPIPDPAAFVREYGRRLTAEFAAKVRAEPIDGVLIRDNGASLAGGRIWIAAVCSDESCVEHRTGIVAVSLF